MNLPTNLNQKSKEELIKELNDLQNKLTERKKELQAIYKISSLMVKSNLSLGEILQESVNIIPNSWQYPKITCAKFQFGNQEYKSENFKISEWKQTETITIENKPVGRIEVYYEQQMPDEDEGPFLKEEKNLLNIIANNISRISARSILENKLMLSEYKFSVSFQKSPVAKCLVDKSDNYRVINVNEKFLNLTGFLREEIEGRFLTENSFISDEIINSLIIPKVKQHNELKNSEFIFQNRRGETKIASLYIETIDLSTNELAILVIHDITEQKDSENKIRQNEKRLQSILDSMQDAYFQSDLSGKITYANPKAIQMYGYHSKDELLGKPASILYAFPKEREKLFAALKETGGIVDWTIQGLKKDGTTFWFSTNVQFLFDEKGNTSGTQSVARDITERIEFEEKLKESETKFRNIFENMPSGYILFELIYDKDGIPVDHRLIAANAEFDNLTGLKREEQLGRTSAELSWFWPKEVTLGYYKVALTRKSFSYERFNDSLKRHYSIRISSPRKGQFALLFNDITERKKAENTMKESNEKLRSVIESTKDLIWTVDPLNFGIQTYNQSLYDYFLNERGIKMQIGDTPQTLVKSKKEDWIGFYKNALKFGKFETEYEAVTETKVLHLSLNVLKRDDKIFGISVFAKDITKHKQHEKELMLAKEKAEESDRLKTAFLLNISHEIRTPMNGILGFMSLLDHPELDEKERSEFIAIVKKSGERLVNTINDIVEISKIEAGDIKMNYEATDINVLMQYHFNFFKIQTEEKGLEFEIKKQLPVENAEIFTDKYKLDSILMNLIKNAIKFTEKGNIEIGNYLENGKLWFYVSDTGKGIQNDKLESIFEHFVQSEAGLSRGHEGSGIGLSIVKAYIEALNGSIEVKSEVDKGSTFLFFIPYIQEEKQNVEIKINNILTEEPNKRTILIAEDDEVNYCFLEKILSKDFKILHADDGKEAIKILKNGPEISLILMDIKLPGKYNGYETTEKIREINQNIPIIAQTAYAAESDKLKALEAGCNDYISKPFTTTNLLSLIQKHLNNKD